MSTCCKHNCIIYISTTNNEVKTMNKKTAITITTITEVTDHNSNLSTHYVVWVHSKKYILIRSKLYHIPFHYGHIRET